MPYYSSFIPSLDSWLMLNYWGRYTTVKNSLHFLFWSIVLMIFIAGLSMLGSTMMFMQLGYESITTSKMVTEYITIAVLCLVFGLPVVCGVMLFFL
jgi:hypothetical protein